MQVTKEHAAKIVELLGHGLVKGLGTPQPGMMCVEAAVCYAIGEPHGDQPTCVSPAVRALKIQLNDSAHWQSTMSRADGMRRLAIAQLGTDTLDDVEFAKRVARLAITTTLPFALRVAAEVQKDQKHRDALEQAALRCEREGTEDAANAANAAANAASAAAYAAYAANAAKHDPEKPLRDFAEGVVQILIDMQAPGTQWLDLCASGTA